MSAPEAARPQTVEIPVDMAVLRTLLEQDIALSELMTAAAILAQRKPETALAALYRRLQFGEQPSLWVPITATDDMLDAMVLLSELAPDIGTEHLANALLWAALFFAADPVPVGHA